MNKDRRDRIAALVERLTLIRDEVEELQEQEQDAYDNMPESLQQTERGEKSEGSARCLEDAVSSLDEAVDYLNSAAE